jgi:hypothetical protein
MKKAGYGPVGPIINGVWDHRDPSKPVTDGFVVEDMGIPGCFGEVRIFLRVNFPGKFFNLEFGEIFRSNFVGLGVLQFFLIFRSLKQLPNFF